MSKVIKPSQIKEKNLEDSGKQNFFHIIQYLVFWISLFLMLATVIFLFKADFKIRQKTVSIPINLENKVNICSPEEEDEQNQSDEF